MKKTVIKIISLIIITALFCTAFTVAPVQAESAGEIQNEINKLEQESKTLEAEIKKLKNDIKNQEKLKTAIESKMAVVQKEINACNKQINLINQQIAKNKLEIENKNKKMEEDKLAFKKRIRAIYMSNTGSNVQILLGSESFSDYLQLSQFTASVSARDKKMIEDIVADVKLLEEKQAENAKLLEQQSEVKATIAAKQAELKSQANEIQGVINSINSNKSSLESENKQLEREIAAMESELNSILYGGSGYTFSNDGNFIWPTTFRRISSYYGPRWGKNHNGLDISDGTYGKPVYAMADGQVYKCVKSCTHNYRKVSSSGSVYSCGCGGGYGNYVAIDHGTYKGVSYKAYYAHMGSVIVSNGATVKKGQILGYIGCTGRSTGPHLHFGVMQNNSWVDPLKFF